MKMVRITEQLIRKKSEHNEGIIGTLEELSLHQEDVEKIELLNNWCKDVQILLLQSNLIPKIENLNKLKKLQYLNLAINNIEKIENLERCESLEKLDLTLNFIGDLESVCNLKNNIHLKHLFLTGNPCADFDGYREYVIAHLNPLGSLDGREITRSERLKAQRILHEIEPKIKEAQKRYSLFRSEQRERLLYPNTHLTDDEFWKTSSEHAPEVRIEMSERSRKARRVEEKETPEKKPKRLFNKDGRPLNINQAKVDFMLADDDPRQYILDIAVYKHLDTNLLDVDVQPTYVKVLIKGKVFQLVLSDEVCTEKSTAKRSQTTGHLVITMHRLNYKEKEHKSKVTDTTNFLNEKQTMTREFLEVQGKDDSMDFSKIVENNKKPKNSFVDNPEVPPLEFGY